MSGKIANSNECGGAVSGHCRTANESKNGACFHMLIRMLVKSNMSSYGYNKIKLTTSLLLCSIASANAPSRALTCLRADSAAFFVGDGTSARCMKECHVRFACSCGGVRVCMWVRMASGRA